MSVGARSGAGGLLWKCAALLAVAAAPVAFNAVVDPARLLGAPADEHAIASALLAGHFVTDIRSYNDRAIVKLLIEGRRGRPDVVALGSSRIQALRASAFPGLAFGNVGVTSARLDDILGLYAMFDTPARRPRRVILNLDANTLDVDASGAAWMSLLPERSRMLEALGVTNSLARDVASRDVDMIKRLASPEYFRYAVFSLRKYGPRGITYTVTSGLSREEWTRTPEGSMAWPDWDAAYREQAVRKYLSDFHETEGQLAMVNHAQVKEREQLLERFIAYLRAEGVEVTLLLVPFHPVAYAGVSAQWLIPAEGRYRALARRLGVPIVGSYDPRVTGTTADDLSDEGHMKPASLARVVRGEAR